jgi:hypothetical protein
MKVHELTRSNVPYKKFKVRNGRVFWTNAYMHGDRRRVCVTRKEKGKLFTAYLKPHTEVDLV